MTAEQIAEEIEKKMPGTILGLAGNLSPCAQKSLIVNPLYAQNCAMILRDNLFFDLLSDVSGVDWIPEALSKVLPSWGHTEADAGKLYNADGFLEAVYHLFSTQKKNLSCVFRLRTADRAIGATLPSLTPVWKSAEFQEREIFDLYGIRFEGHPDLRRIMMWDEFEDHPMRKDFAGMPSQLAEKESAE